LFFKVKFYFDCEIEGTAENSGMSLSSCDASKIGGIGIPFEGYEEAGIRLFCLQIESN